MKQGSLQFAPRSKPSAQKVTRGFDIGNLRSAELIIADVDKWGGEPSGLVIWARAVVRRLTKELAA